MLEKLDNAIAELQEAKRLAKLFNWPESVVNRINLVLRGTVHYRNQIAEEMVTHGDVDAVSAAVH